MPITINPLVSGVGGDNLSDSAEKINGNFDALVEMINDTLETHSTRHAFGGADEVNGDTVSIAYSPTNYTRTLESDVTTSVNELTSHLKGIDVELLTKSDTDHNHDSDYSALSHNHDLDYADIDHDATHITSGTDEIDGDKLDIDWNPTNYTPALVTNYADSVDNLTAHLKGIDVELGSSTGITTGKAIAMAMVFS